MSITAAGLYGLTLEKFLNATSFPASGLESETAVKGMLITDSETPDFSADNFRDDVEANEVSGTGYSAGGVALTSTELTIASGVLTYDCADPSWASSTISNAMALVGYIARGGASSADELVFLLDFVNVASSSGGTLLVQIAAAGVFTWDFTP